MENFIKSVEGCPIEVDLLNPPTSANSSMLSPKESTHFNPSPEYGLFSHSAVALIKPEEFGQLELPGQWGSRQDAEALLLES